MAVAAKDSPEEKSPYAVNKPLYDEATSIKGKMKLVEGRIEKMEQHRSEVSESVYFKVKNDYNTELDGVRRSFEEKCKALEGELGQLYRAQAKHEDELAGHLQILEEAKFRHVLGEYTDKKFKEVESKENKEIKTFNDLLDIIKGSIKQYEEVLGHPFQPGTPSKTAEKSVKPAASTPPPPQAKPTIPKAAPQKTAIEEDTLKALGISKEIPTTSFAAEDTGSLDFEEKLSEDLDMILGSEGDYFSQESEALLNESTGIKEPVAPAESTPKAKATAPTTAKPTPNLDDSLSKILRDIPMDEFAVQEEASEVSITVNPESTGAKIKFQDTPQEASLLLLQGELDESEIFLSENTSIGRSPSNDIVLKESKISRQHATINFRDGHYVIVDLKSSNGILVNGKKVEEAYLSDGDEISIGSFKFQFNLS
jgi:FHA domain-containing protein